MNRVVFARAFVVALVLAASAATAMAQGQPGSGMPTGPSMGPEEEKKEGVAEAAPKTPGLLPTTPVLPAPKNRRKRWKLFELDGYMRFRTRWDKNFHLGFKDDNGVENTGSIGTGGSPFPRSPGCNDSDTTDGITPPCEGNLSSANMRLKLMPTFNIDEGTAVYTEIDVLDNLVLGSTPDTLDLENPTSDDPPLAPFGQSQVSPQRGRNGTKDSISVRRVWAEVGLPLGILKFGRMPDHWGMGIMANSGTEDTFNGGIDLDADYGDTVDRLSFSAIIPGTRLRGGIATDWGNTALSSDQTFENKDRGGQPWDMADDDDTDQWLLTISQLDAPTVFADAVARGELAYNWGIRFAYRTQKRDYDMRDVTNGTPLDSSNVIDRGYKAYVPDVWFKAAYKQYQLELEGVAVLGSIDNLKDYDVPGSVDLRQFGGVGRFTYTGIDGKLKLGVELGAASGDQWDNDPQGSTHISHANLIGAPGDRTRVDSIRRFIFDQDYKVDMILFRELIGAVTNAAYVKPSLAYDLTKSLRLKVSGITAMALKPVSTPGNSDLYGVELDTDLGYDGHNGFFAGVSYGVLFPLGAMDHPSDDLSGGPGFEYPNDNVGDAGNAHTIQFRLALQF